jgi:hypothetical protein
MGFKDDPGRETRHSDQQALDEIRRQFARYRQNARHRRVTEQYEPPEPRPEHPEQAPTLPRH